MSDTYKFLLIRNYLKYYVKGSRELKDLLDYLDKLQQKEKIEKLQNQLQQKENIIKEVRELINYYGITPEQNDDTTFRSILKQFLGILDKDII